MRLKRIKLAGFKSFVDATNIPFPGEMTAIVGPNGCGKSNVIDAVRWVLGESSAKNLRGDAMTDVIFNGSSARKPVSQCSVELVFDNTSKRIQGEFANYNELAVKRIVTRDAQSTYLLNGTKCRRRDVTDIFLGTGLGPRSYAIIEQGMISRLIESKPQELRVFIEEAAGISKYKERRRETENRIRHTRENLERLADVRTELGSQLDKLQRQAAAARRYTELKAKERQLKAELAAIRWLSHTEKVSELQLQIDESETQIEALIAQQQGDERHLVEAREQQAELKQRIDDLQQQLFKVSTEITRLEQNQQYVEQRGNQINNELQGITAKSSELQAVCDETQIAYEQALAISEQLAPEIELSEQQIEAASEQRDAAETAYNDFAKRFREQEHLYLQLKNQSQSCHSQVQSTMNMQLRTQQRLSDIDDELMQLEHDQIATQLASLQEQLAISQEQLDEAKSRVLSVNDQLGHQQTIQRQLHQSKGQLEQQFHRYQAELQALEALQQDEIEQQSVDTSGLQQLWQVLKIRPGAEPLFDIALNTLNDAWVIDTDDQVREDWLESAFMQIVMQNFWVEDKKPGTLAALTDNPQVPVFLNHILVAESEQHMAALVESLSPTDTIVCENGMRRQKDTLTLGKPSAQGKVQRQAKIEVLHQQCAELDEKLSKAQLEISEQEQVVESLNSQVLDAKQAEQHSQQAHYQVQNKVGVLEMQAEQAVARKQKLLNEQNEQQGLLAKEQLQLEELSARIEEIEAQLLEFESEQLHFESSREAHESAMREARAQVEQLRQHKHQLDLQHQQQSNAVQTLHQRLEDVKRQLEELSQRTVVLNEELTALRKPTDDGGDRIRLLLDQREEIVAQQQTHADQLADIERTIADAQRDSHGLNDRIAQRRAQLESLKLESQGYQVRATAVLEQLQDTQQNLKETLETLPPERDEKTWQTDLEKTQASIGRLGAVNLAAVDEFEVQAERKQHLDTQFDDLQAALDTLEDAIRKIDRETKTRFRKTFDQVNDDLKRLFPKVFGGGSAYLDLTDDDLLETGVTIMARPPGKKNSTIHLLSGGEKALTALSLVFAIFRLNPAPFCLLDEVDAPLDDANVERFCRLVSEMSQTVQFIYITHNKIAMEMAEHLTGVTMAEPGVSRMVAVDVEEAVAIANA